MEVRCPSCRKVNEDLAECRRCGCELSVLLAIAGASVAQAARAEACLCAHDAGEALRAAVRSWELKHNARAARVAFLASVAAGEFEQACAWHRRACGFGATAS